MGDSSSKASSENIENKETLNCETCTIEIDTNSKIDFGCLHNFCLYCIQQIFTDAIDNSELEKLKCPSNDCDANASSNLIESVVTKEKYEKYKAIRTSRIWDTCPKCQNEDIGNEPGHYYSLCNACKYAFCTKCGNDYHGLEGECQLQLSSDDDDYEDAESSDSFTDLFEEMSLTEAEGLTLTSDDKFDCGICFGSFTIGSDFGCGHTYCKTCISIYLETKIKDGSVYGIKCPWENCDVKAEPSLIKVNVSSEIYEKYDETLLNDMLAKDMPELVNCPNVWCQQRVIAEPEYGHCTKCDFRFCTGCNQAFHGVSPCGLTEEERKEEIRKYIEATEVERRELERQEDLKRKKHDEESNNLIKTVCKKCPSCNTNIEKSIGCNRMHCTKCTTNFCWLCLQIINSKDPYLHYNVAGSKCALFEVPN